VAKASTPAQPGSRDAPGNSLPAVTDYIVPDFVHVLVDGQIVRSAVRNWRWNWKNRLRWAEAETGQDCLPEAEIMTIAPEQLGNYLEIFDNLQKHSRRTIRAGFGACARTRWCVSTRPIPTTRDEDWRFTNVSVLAQIPFRMAASEHQRYQRGRSNSMIWPVRLSDGLH